MIFFAIIIGCILGAILGLNAPMISYTYSNEKRLFSAGTVIYENEAGGIVKFDKKW